MKISKVKDLLVISYLGRDAVFSGLPQINRKKNTLPDARGENGNPLSRDELLFLELEKHWSTLQNSEKEELWEAYDLLAALTTAEPDIVAAHIPSIFSIIDKYHSDERYKELYPVESIWVPEKLQSSFEGMSPNYTQDMTYISPEYYELAIFTLRSKAYVPLFNVLGAYVNGKNMSQETKRKIVYNTNRCFELLQSTSLAHSVAIPKLRRFLIKQVEKFQKENTKGMYGTSLSVLASVRGYGSDMLEDYIVAFSIVHVLALHPVGADYKNGNLSENNIVARVFWDVKQEVEGGYANKISGQNVLLKQHPKDVVFNGERGKISAVDLVTARSPAPVKEYARSGVSFEDYRRYLKTLNIDVPPATVKTLITSIQENHTGPTYELHEWLVAVVLHRKTDRRTYKDVDPDKFLYAMGIAQAVYLHYGMREVAALLSCEMAPGNIMGHPIDPIDSDIKIKLDRYYPHAYRLSRNSSGNENTVRDSLTLLISNHIAPYHFNLRATPEAAAILQCETSIDKYRLGNRIQSQLAEMLYIQARHKCDEVQWFNS